MNYLSLFSGIEAASVAWQPLGWQPVAFAEIEPFPCAVLAHHYPDVPNLGDVTKITDEQIAALGQIDVVVGGSPCQDLSVAGKRRGLAGERSSLFHEQIRIFHAARHLCGARWLIWENVPGAFSSNGGGDFACVAGALAGCKLNVPADGWGQEGVALGEHGLVEWSVLDAQWFGLAQRRKRVFAVLDTGNWSDRPPVLLERDSLRGDTAPRRQAGQNAARTTGACTPNSGAGSDELTAAVAPTLLARSRIGGGLGSDFEMDGGLVATANSTPYRYVSFGEYSNTETASTLKARDNKDATDLIATPTAIVFQCHGGSVGEMGTLRATDSVQSGVPFTLAVHGSQDPDTLIEHAHTLGRNQGQENVVYTLTERGRAGGHALEYRCDGTPNGGRAGMGVGAISICKTANTKSNGLGISGEDTAYTLDTAPNQAVALDSCVRRLTPRECERLQGFPDDYTLIPWRTYRRGIRKGISVAAMITIVLANAKALFAKFGKTRHEPDVKECPDGPRYRALGNSMAVPVMRWIGRQIDAATHASTNESSTMVQAA